MSKLEFIRTTIDSCPNCNGCWLDANEITQLTRSRGSRAIWLKLTDCQPSELKCPRCDQRTVQIGNVETARKKLVEVDECTVCGGLWLDRGELTALLERA
jgi:Zn-finger nucleic acid-binding protein